MSKEEEDEESNNMNLSRFPCMPSLVALQQMRNRLHMAYVGKKLMKWTAQATGRELRKIAFELSKTCHHFREDVRDSYIRLARARYFYPSLNNVVLEHIGKKAEMTIDVKTKSVTGVKILRLELMDSREDTYPHLGIEKGGEAIRDAKYAWKHLLKRIVHMIEQRVSFAHVDEAHRGATKKTNVIEKIIIPKSKQTIKFILDEIEELEREDTYRLKMFKKLKDAHLKKEMRESKCTCPSPYATEGKNYESVCFVCKMRFKNTPGNKLYIEHILSHIDDMVTLSKHYKLDESVPGEMDRFVKSCDEIKRYIEEYVRDPFMCNVCKINNTTRCYATDICKTAPAFDFKEPGISNSESRPCSDNASPNISIVGYSTPGQECPEPVLLKNDIIELNAPNLATCQCDETFTRLTKTSSDSISSSSVPSHEITTPSPSLTIDYLKALNTSQLPSCQYGECDSINRITTDVLSSRCFYQCEVNSAAEAIHFDTHAREVSTSKSAKRQYDDKSDCSASCQETAQETIELVDNYSRDFATSVSATCQCDILTTRNATPCQENTPFEAESVDFFTGEPHASKSATCQNENNNIPPSGYKHQWRKRVPKQFDNYMRDFSTPEACKCDGNNSLCMYPDKTNSESKEKNMPEKNDYFSDLGSSNFNFQNIRTLSVYSNPWQQRTTSRNLHTNNNITYKNSPICHCADRPKTEYSWHKKAAPENSQMNEYSREYHTFVFESSITNQCTGTSKEDSVTKQANTTSGAIHTNYKTRIFDNSKSITCECSNTSSIRQTKSYDTGQAVDHLPELNQSQSASCQYHDKNNKLSPWQESTTPVAIDYLGEFNDLKTSSCPCSNSVSTIMCPTKSSSENERRGFVPNQERATPETGPAIDYLRELNPSQSASRQYHDKPISKYSNPWQDSTKREPLQVDYVSEFNDFKSSSCQCSNSLSTKMRPTKSLSDIETRRTLATCHAIDYLRELNPSKLVTCKYHDRSVSGYSNPRQENAAHEPVQIDYRREIKDFKSSSCQCSDSVSTKMRPTKSFSDIETRGFASSNEKATPETGHAIDYPREINPSISATCQYHGKSVSGYSNPRQENTASEPKPKDYTRELNSFKSTSGQCQYLKDSVSTKMRPTNSFGEKETRGFVPSPERATLETSQAIDYPRELNPSISATCQYHGKSVSGYSNPRQENAAPEPVQIDYSREIRDLKSSSCQCSDSVSTKMRPTKSFSDIETKGFAPSNENATPKTGQAIDYPREINPSISATCQYHGKSVSGYSNLRQENAAPEPVQIDDSREIKDFKSTSGQCQYSKDSVSTKMRPNNSFGEKETRSFVPSPERSTPETSQAIYYPRELNPSISATCQYNNKSISAYSNPRKESSIREPVKKDYLREFNDFKSSSCQCSDSVSTKMRPTKSLSDIETRIFTPSQEKATPETGPAIEYPRELNPSQSATCQYQGKSVSGYLNPRQENVAPEPVQIDYSREIKDLKSSSCQCSDSVSTKMRPTKSFSDIETTGFAPSIENATPETGQAIDYPREINPSISATCQYHGKSVSGYSNPRQENTAPEPKQKDYIRELNSFKSTSGQCQYSKDSLSTKMRPTDLFGEKKTGGFVPTPERATPETSQAIFYPRELNPSILATCQYNNKSISAYSNPRKESSIREPVKKDYLREFNDFKSSSCQCSDSVSTKMRPTKSLSDIETRIFTPSQEKATPETGPAIEYPRELNPSQSATCQYQGKSVSGYLNPRQENVAPEPVQIDYSREIKDLKSSSCQCSDSVSTKMRPTKSFSDIETTGFAPSIENATPETGQAIDYPREINPSISATCQYHGKSVSGYSNPRQENTAPEPKQKDYIRELNSFKSTSGQCQYSKDSLSTKMRPTDLFGEKKTGGFVPTPERATPETSQAIFYPRELNPSISATCQYINKSISAYSNPRKESTTRELVQIDYLREINDLKSCSCQCSDSLSTKMRPTKSLSDIETRGTTATSQAIDYLQELNPSKLVTCQYHDNSVSGYSNPWQKNTIPELVHVDYLGKFDTSKSISCQCRGSVSTNINSTKSSSNIVSSGIFPGQERTTPEIGLAIEYPRELNPSQSATCQYHNKSVSGYLNPWRKNTALEPVQIDNFRKFNDFKSSSCQCSDSLSTNIRPTTSSFSDTETRNFTPRQEKATPETGLTFDYPRELNSSQSATCQYHNRTKTKNSNSCQENTTSEPVQIDYLREIKDFKSSLCQCSDSVSTKMRPTKSFSDIETRGFAPSQEKTTLETGLTIDYPRELNPSQSATCQYQNKTKTKNSNPWQESTIREPVQIEYLREFNDSKCTSCLYSVTVSTNLRSTQSFSDIVSSGIFPGQERTTPEMGPAIEYPRELNPSLSTTCQYHDNSISTYFNPRKESTTTATGPAIECLRELNPSTCQYNDKSVSGYSNPRQKYTIPESVQVDYLRNSNASKSTLCQCRDSVSTNMHTSLSSSNIVSSGIFPGQERTTPEIGLAIKYPRELNPSQSATCQYHDKSVSGYSNPWQENTSPKPVQIDYGRELNSFKSTSGQCQYPNYSVSTNMRPTKSFSEVLSGGVIPSQEKSTPETDQAIDYPRELNPSQSATCQYNNKSVSGYSNPWPQNTAPEPKQIDYSRELNSFKSTSGECQYLKDYVSTKMRHTNSFVDKETRDFVPSPGRATPETGQAIDYPRELNPSISANCQYHDKSISGYKNPWQESTAPEPVQVDYLRKLNASKSTSCLCSDSVFTHIRPNKSSSEVVSRVYNPSKEKTTSETGQVIDYLRERNPSKSATSQYNDKSVSGYSNTPQENTAPESVQIDYMRELNASESSICQCPNAGIKPISGSSMPYQEVTAPEVAKSKDYFSKFSSGTLKSQPCHCDHAASKNFLPTKESERSKTSNNSGPYYENKPMRNYSYIYNRIGKPIGEEIGPPKSTLRTSNKSGPYYENKAMRNYSYIYNRVGKSISEEIEQPKTTLRTLNNRGPYYENKPMRNYSYIYNRVGKPICEEIKQPKTTLRTLNNRGPYYENKSMRNYSYIYNRVGKPISEEIEPQKTSNNYDTKRGPYHDININITPSICKTGISSKVASSKSVNVSLREKPLGSRKTAEADNAKSFNLNVDDTSLGFFEKQIQEIVRVTRGVDEDGAMIEEKQFITIRTEKRAANKSAKFNTDITQDLKEFNVECSSHKVPATRETKSQNPNVYHATDSPINMPCTSKSNTICQNKIDTIPKYDCIFKNSSMEAPNQASSHELSCKCVLWPATDSTNTPKKSYESFGCQFKFSSFHSLVSEPEKTAKDSFPKTYSINTLNCNPEGCQLNQISTIKPSFDSISKKPPEATQQNDLNISITFKGTLSQITLERPCPCENEDCAYNKDETTSCIVISCLSKNTSTDALSKRSSKNTLASKYKSCSSASTATSIETITKTATCMTEHCPYKKDATTSSYFVISCLSQNTSTDTMLGIPSGNTLSNKYKSCRFKNAATKYDAIRYLTEKTSTDTLLLKSSANKLPYKHKIATTSFDTVALLTEKTSTDEVHEPPTKHHRKHLCSNCKQELIKEPESAKKRPHPNFMLVPYARTVATQTGYNEVWVDTTIMKKTSCSSTLYNCNTKASSPIWTEVETPKSNVSMTCSGKSNFKSNQSIFGDKTTEYNDDQVKVIIKIIPKTQARMTCSAGTILAKPLPDKCVCNPHTAEHKPTSLQDEKPSTLSCPIQTQSCRPVKIKQPHDNCDCEEFKNDRHGSMLRFFSCKKGQSSGSTKCGTNVSCWSSAIGTCKSTSSQPGSARLKHSLVSDKTNSEEELYACNFQKNRSNKSSCTGTSIYSAKVSSHRASRATLRSGTSTLYSNVSTLTKRSDRFDLRTLRQLRIHTSTHSRRKISFTPHPSRSDPHFNKVKAKRRLRKCHSSSDGDYYHRW